MHRLLLVCLLIIAVPSQGLANDLSRADSALMRGDYPAAITILEDLSDAGDPTAMVYLASLYHRGEGVARDIAKAAELYLAAAELGNPEAQFNLGNMYLLGEGLPQDEAWALSFYRLAAGQGHALAEQNMRELYRANGIGQDTEDAGAAEPAATVPAEPDVTQAAAGPADAEPLVATNASVPYRDSPADEGTDGMPAAAPPEQAPTRAHDATPFAEIEPAADDAAEPLVAAEPRPAPPDPVSTTDEPLPSPTVERATGATTGAQSGPEAVTSTGFIEAAGVEETPMVTLEPVADPVEAVARPLPADQAEALRLAKAHGIEVDIGSQTSPSALGDSVQQAPPIDVQAADHAERLAGARRMLALENYDHAINRLHTLVDEGSGEAAWLLSGLYRRGEGVEMDEQRAIQWHERAAKLGHAEAQFELAGRYSEGRGVAPDEAMAITYYRDAARSGHPQAREKLRAFYADAGLPMPELTRPRTPIAITGTPASGPSEPADSGAGAPLVSQRDPTESAAVAEPSSEIGSRPMSDESATVAAQADDARSRDAILDEADSITDATEAEDQAVSETLAVTPLPDAADPDRESSGDSPAPVKSIVIAQPRLDPDALVVHPDRVAEVPDTSLDPGPALPANHEVIPGSVLAVTAFVVAPEPSTPAESMEPVEAKEFAVAEREPDAPLAAAADGPYDAGGEVAAHAPVDAGLSAAIATGESATVEVRASGVDAVSVPAAPTIAPPAVDPMDAGASTIGAGTAAIASGTALAATSAASATAPAKDTTGAASGGLLKRLTGWFSREPQPGAQPVIAMDSNAGQDPGAAAATETPEPLAEPEFVETPGVPITDPVAVVSPLPDEPVPIRTLADESTVSATFDDRAADAAVASDEYATPAAPQPLPTVADGKRALAAGEVDVAARIFKRLGEAGDPEAQAHIGYMYYIGEGVEADLAQAVEWYRRAAVHGNRDAQYNLAVAYAFGEGVDQDDSQAVTWYRRAAEQGSAIAQYSLGMSYALGEGVEQDDATAITWYRAAAEQGYAAAQYNLGYSYRTGHGIEPDEAEALRWFEAAATNGHASAQYSLGYMYRSGRGVERNVDEAIKWYRLAAAQGHPDARADLASLNPGG